MYWIWLIVIGGLAGWLTGLIFSGKGPRSGSRNFLAGVLGAWLGDQLIEKGPIVESIYIVPAIIVAVVLSLFITIVWSQREN